MNTSEGLDSNDLASVSIEEPLCSYLSAFDGSRKDFDTHIRPHFDNLFSDNLIYLVDGHPVDNSAFTCINKQLREQRSVATLEDIYFVDDEHVEYTVHWCNESTSLVTHVVALVVDGKIVLIKPCEETEGVFANLYRSCQDRYRSPLNQLKRFRGWARETEEAISKLDLAW